MTYKTKKITISMITSAAVLGVLATGALAHMEPKKGDNMEKCYGVVKAGQNECASKENKHGCAGMAKTDSDPNEWIKLPNGLCKKLIKGGLESEKISSTKDPLD